MISEPEATTESMRHPLASSRPPTPTAPTFSGQTANAAVNPPAPPSVAFSGQTAGDMSGANSVGNVAFSGLTVSAAGEIATAAQPYLDHLSELAKSLGVIDPVETFLNPLLGRWGDLRAEGDRLRRAAEIAGAVSEQLADGLGKLDAGWSGQDADMFVAYMGEIRVAGGDLREALDTLAHALDEMLTSVHHVVVDLVDVLVDTTELVTESATLPVGGERRAREQLQEASQSAKALFEAARDVIEAFGRLCNGVDDPDGSASTIEIAHRYPPERFKLHDADGGATTDAEGSQGTEHSAAGASDDVMTPSAAHEPEAGRQTGSHEPTDSHDGTENTAGPTPTPADQSASANHGSTGMSMMPMGFAGIGAMGGGASRRQPKSKTVSKPSQLFGDPELAVPPVIGEDETPKPQPEAKPKPPASS